MGITQCYLMWDKVFSLIKWCYFQLYSSSRYYIVLFPLFPSFLSPSLTLTLNSSRAIWAVLCTLSTSSSLRLISSEQWAPIHVPYEYFRVHFIQMRIVYEWVPWRVTTRLPSIWVLYIKITQMVNWLEVSVCMKLKYQVLDCISNYLHNVVVMTNNV